MGEVYEVEDLELKERVALKTIRPEVAQDQKMIERFKREIQLARNVTHPNVCRIFDLGFHRTGEPSGDWMFLTMELLNGETLAARIRRGGRMKPSEALPIAVQMAAGLAAAHKAGVIHRDFKTGNVILVPSKEGNRVVVTDFGLARRSQASGGAQTASSSVSEFMGTPAYMAPEQVRGDPVTLAADIYALGVVLYEMVTGTWPFTGDNPLAIAAKRLEGPPTPPRKYVPDLEPKWEAAILRCLERESKDRFQSATAVAEALGTRELAYRPNPALAHWVAVGMASGIVLTLFLLLWKVVPAFLLALGPHRQLSSPERIVSYLSLIAAYTGSILVFFVPVIIVGYFIFKTYRRIRGRATGR
jgi:eukaryotic-like serine/threonine-protein kinase